MIKRNGWASWAALAIGLSVIAPVQGEARADSPQKADGAPGAGTGAAAGLAQIAEVPIAPAPDWTRPPPADTGTPAPENASVRFIYSDNQALAGPNSLETYTAIRVRLLKPEALQFGNLTLSWTPGAGGMTLHWLRVIRQGKTIDLTRTAKFTVVRRESGLELAMLDGRLTAFYQVPDLQVGDELEWAATATSFDPTLREHRSGIALLPQGGMPGAFRTRLLWPEGAKLRWQATPDVMRPAAAKVGKLQTVSFEMTDPGAPPEAAMGSPGRFSLSRLIEFSDFADWAELSRRVRPLYDKAAQLNPDSPVRAEAAKIAASTTDPIKRTEAALQLVEDRIRYVYVGMDGGNMTPADADETWQRRFGDCKGKTVLLIALLRELGITADPLLVNSRGGDGMDQRLPNPSLFDHVVARASVNGKLVLLDGTRLGDRALAQLPPTPWRFGLPVTAQGAKLEKLAMPVPPWPQGINVLDIDARAGLAEPTRVTARRILRGDDAIQLATWLSSVPADQAQRAIKDYWHGEEPWVDAEQASWKMDQAAGVLTLTLTGEGDLTIADPDYPATAVGGRIPSSALSTPARLRRPKSQDQSLPWVTGYPSFQCWATTLRLPPGGASAYWSLFGEGYSRVIGGAELMRRAGLTGDIARSVISRRFLTPEISAADAIASNAQVADFDAYPLAVRRQALFKGAARWPDKPLPFTDATDWTAPDNPCMAPPVSTSAGKAAAPPAPVVYAPPPAPPPRPAITKPGS